MASSLMGRRVARYAFTRPVSVAVGCAAAQYALWQCSERLAEEPGESAFGRDPALSMRLASVAVVACAPLFGISAVGCIQALRGMGSLRWASQTWERGAWSALFAGASTVAATTPVQLLAGTIQAPPWDEDAIDAVGCVARTTRSVGAAVGASGFLAVSIGERLGSSFGRLACIPLVLSSAFLASQSECGCVAVLATAVAVVPLLYVVSLPVYTHSHELLGAAVWLACSLVPTASRAMEAFASPEGARDSSAVAQRRHIMDSSVAPILVEQLAGAVCLLLLQRYLAVRRPVCQY